LHRQGASFWYVAEAADPRAVQQWASAASSVLMDTPWKRRSARQKSDKQEARIAKLPGGRRQINSGRTTFASKRDNKLGGFLIEARTTGSGRYCVTRREWEDLILDAQRTPPGMLPAMQIDLGPHQLIVMQLKDHLDREQRLTDA
jgi:hypothetical protein